MGISMDRADRCRAERFLVETTICPERSPDIAVDISSITTAFLANVTTLLVKREIFDIE